MNKTTFSLHRKNAFSFFLFFFLLLISGNVFGQATLPVSTTTLSRDALPVGFTQSGLGTNYANNIVSGCNTSLKFDDSNDSLTLFYDSPGETLTFKMTGNGFSGGNMKVQESINGSAWTDVATITTIGASQSYSYTVTQSSRYIKWTYTKSSGNVALCSVGLTKYVSTCTAPTTQATSFTSSAITQNTATVGWLRGNGNEVLVVARAGSAVNTDPISGTNYTANAAFGSADTQIGTGNYVVYKGVGTSVNLTSLTAGTTYHFAVYEYNTTGICFNTTELIGSVTTNQPPSLTITGSLSENTTLNGGQVTLTLANETFSDNSLLQSNFTLNNAPAGVTISNVQYSSPTSAIVTLAYDGTDFDTSVTNFNIAINSDELSVSTSTLNSNSLTITAVNETLTVGNMSSGFGDQCVNVLSNYRTFTISSSTVLKAGTISLAALNGFTYSETADNEEYTTTLSFTHAGGTLASKTIYVKFKPTVTTPAYSGNISITATSTTPAQTQATATRSVSGTGTNGTPAVTNKLVAETVTHISASSGGTAVSAGCGTITAKGVVWGTTSNPTIALLTKTNEGAGTANYDSNITGLYPNTQYFYRAYATNSNGVTSYGENNNFTTALAPCNPETFSAGTAQASATTIVSGGSTNLSLTGASAASGLSYQWQRLTNGEWSDISLATNATYSATNITANTSYRCKVTCGEITKESASVVVSLTYCSAGATNTSFEKISNFTFGSINKNSTSTVGYEDFTSTESTNIQKGNPVPFSVSLSASYSGDQVIIWVDLNNNKVFDNDEKLFTSVISNANLITGTITIPNTATEGSTRLRIRLHDTEATANATPCGTSTYGQVEDYTVNIQAPPPALTVSPTSLSGFNYVVGNGASSAQKIVLSGANLNGSDVELLVDSAFEISENENSGYAEDITLTAYDGSSKDIWVRLKAGQSVNSYNGSVLISGGGDSVTYEVALSGNVYNTVDYSKLQWPQNGEIYESVTGNNFTVYAKAYENGVTNVNNDFSQITAWIGYNTVNDDPRGNPDWTWILANGATSWEDNNSNYQYSGNLNANNLPAGTYYYATRFQMGANAPYTYGGNNLISTNNEGGNWGATWGNPLDNITYRNGTLVVTPNVVDWCNLQSPHSGTITQCDSYTVYAQVYEAGLTPNNGTGISAWIGYSTENTNPNTWTNWIEAGFNVNVGDNNEYQATLNLPAGTYYYASRFQKQGSTEYRYGGTNNNFWTTSGTLTINTLTTPTATAATNVTDESFTANWNAVTGATSYEVEVWTETGGMSENSASAYWNFTTASPTVTGNNVSVSALSQGNNKGTTGTTLLDNSSASNYTGASGGNNAGIAARIGALETGTSGSAYFQFTVTPNAGATVTLTGISFGTRSTGTGPQAYTLRSSLDNYASDVATGTMGTLSWVLKTNAGLSLAGNEAITFRLFGYSGTGSPSDNLANWRIDDLRLDMTVASSTLVNTPIGTYTIEPENNVLPTSYTVTGLNDNTTYHYVVRAINGACETVNSNEITVRTSVIWNGTAWSNTAGPDETIDAIIEGEYITNEDGEFTAKSLIVRNATNTSGSLTVSNQDVVTVIGALHNQTGSATAVTIESGAVLLQNGTTNTNTGNITVKRNSSAIKRLDYTLWSSPVAGQEIYAFSPTTLKNRFYIYNSAINGYSSNVGFDIEFDISSSYPSPMTPANPNDGINGIDNAHVLFATAKSYLIRVPWNHPTAPAVFAGQFTGVPNSGDITYTMDLAGTPSSGYGYNAVGNPYPSKLNIKAFFDANPNITKTLYFWRKTNNSAANTYATINEWSYTKNDADGGDTGTGFFNNGNQANWVINTGQGFLVQASEDAINENSEDSKKLYFTNAMRRSQTNHDQFFRTSSSANSGTQGLYWLNLSNATGFISQISAGYTTVATLGVDNGIDAKNINTDIYLASLINDEDYAIQGRPSFEDTDEVPLSYKVVTAGNHSIAIDHVSGIFADGQEIYLKDNLLGTIHNLTNDGAYNFTTNAGTFSERFEVVYANSALGVDKPTFNENQVVVYKNENSQFVVNTGNVEMSSIKVFDLRGRLLTTQDDINASQTNLQVDVATQVLLLQITSVDGLTVTKKIIK